MLLDDNLEYTEPGAIASVPQRMAITWQDQGFFKGYSCNAVMPNGIFSGVIDGKKISSSDWASTMFGSVNEQWDTMNFITQNQHGNPDSTPGICMETAKNTSYTFDCDPIP